MKSGRLNLRISEKRLAKLKIYAGSKEKTITQLVEDWIDRLPSHKIDDSLSTPLHKSS
jgi:predicted HicB family RNase H-like nuclease